MCSTKPPPFLRKTALSNDLHDERPSFLAWATRQADSWWLKYVVRDDVFISGIGDQALNIFPNSPESAQMMVIMKWYIHSHVHSHSPIHTLKIT